MKKIISILLVISIVITLAACKNSGKTPNMSGNSSNIVSDELAREDHNTDRNEPAWNNYNVVLFDSCVNWIDEKFQKENRIKGATYDEKTLWDTGAEEPETRTFIVDDGRLEGIFADGFPDFQVDFDHEMIIIYTFATEYVLPAKIKAVELSDRTLTINYYIELVRGTVGAVRPYQRWFVVKLDKLDIITATNMISFEYIN